MATKPITLITGAAQGIGAAIAKRMASAGHNIALNYLSNHEKAHHTAKECEARGARVIVLQADVSKPEECQRIVAETMDKFAQIDLLVNNAGLASFGKAAITDVAAIDLEPFNRIFNTNVLGALAMSQAVVPHMQKRNNGAIINISSGAGITGSTNTSIIYAASKGALNTLTIALAKALTPTIRVNAVCPGFVDSTWWEKRFPDAEEKTKFISDMTKRNPLGKIVTPEEIANTVLFLFENSSINGELIRVDSGWH